MRYPDGGGLTAAGRVRREAVRLQAAEWFDQDVSVPEIAKRLRVSQNAVYVWRRRWLVDGEAGLVSKGPAGSGCRLSPEQLDRLATALKEGPAAHGWIEDQRWTLARIADLIARLFRVQYTLRGVSLLLHRMGFSPQTPAHRPVERDDEAIATWREETWAQAKASGRAWGVALLQRRSGPHATTAQGADLGASRANTSHPDIRQGIRPHLRRRTVLCAPE